ncbi:MAG TPA: HD domain-containing phosphohydrolase [Acidobacteriaceae bacterium]|nr:HD domain-containing phosphohydrolase [Acidobacteriaceae bacterium]
MSRSNPRHQPGANTMDGRIHLAEIISALSFALDLTEGAVHGHAVRSCLLGMRIAHEVQLPAAEMPDLYYALLLKDVGCSSNAARMCQIVGGDDRAIKAGAKLIDWTRPNPPRISTLKLLWKNVLPESSAAKRIARIVKMGRTQHKNNEAMITLRCERGADIMRKLEFSTRAADAVRSLDEHWDGSGYPDRLKGDQVPYLSRILAVAQHLDVFSTGESPRAAINVLQARSGRWFDPELVQVAVSLHRSGGLWTNCLPIDHSDDTRTAAVDLAPGANRYLQSEQIDQICEAFADVVDAKSPYTFSHSLGVAHAAVSIAHWLGLPTEQIDFVRRAALLHDIGKLSISNSILDKAGVLSPEEWQLVRDHPVQTRRILERIGAFRALAKVAGEHHEKLDGSGYPDGLVGKQLSLESRIITVADVYGALSEDRPYRAGLSREEIAGIMKKDVPGKLDSRCFEALMDGVAAAETDPSLVDSPSYA